MIDPGSAYTLVHAPIIQSFGLTYAGKLVPIFTPSTGSSSVTLRAFHVSLTIMNQPTVPRSNLVMNSIPVVEAQLDSFAALGVQVVIGCAVLERCLFFYEGPSKLFSLAY